MAAASTRVRRARSAGGGGARAGRARSALRERLEARKDEIEAAALTRVRVIADPSEVADPTYADGLRAAVSAAISYGIETAGHEGNGPPIPVVLLAQARMAARVGVPLDTVLRRYFAGYSLLGYYILEEAASVRIADGDELKRVLGTHAGIFDRLLTAIGEEYGREAASLKATSRHGHQEAIERLLDGEALDVSAIPYDFEAWHLGVVAVGTDAAACIRTLARHLDANPLILERKASSMVWAWLGKHCGPKHADELPLPEIVDKASIRMAFGEPAKGLDGWRFTHLQAVSALPLAQRGDHSTIRFGQVSLLAAANRDEVVATTLRNRYILPIEHDRDGGETAKKTLRAYLAANLNVSSAAAVLGVRRNTVTGRLRRIEDLLGRSLDCCVADMEIALRLDELARPK